MILLVWLWLAGCDDDCTDLAVGSVNLTVDGPTSGVVATWTLDGRTKDCDAIADTWVCGWDAVGAITIEVDAPGYSAVSTTVTVAGDGCHAVAEVLEVTLVAE